MRARSLFGMRSTTDSPSPSEATSTSTVAKPQLRVGEMLLRVEDLTVGIPGGRR